MRFLVDANLSPRVAIALTAGGHDAIHVFDVDLATASDRTILEAAFAGDRIIVSSDTDFGALLAQHEHQKPSFILLRHLNDVTPDTHAQLLLANIPTVADDLEAGAVVTIDGTRIRVRRLPILRGAVSTSRGRASARSCRPGR